MFGLNCANCDTMTFEQTQHILLFQIDTFKNNSSTTLTQKIKCVLNVGKCFTFQRGGGENNNNNNSMAFDEAARDTWKKNMKFLLAKFIIRVSVHAWVLSTHLNNSLFLSSFLALPLTLITLHAPISFNWLVYIFLYRFDTFHFCYFHFGCCFNLLISECDTIHLHLLTNAKSHLHQGAKNQLAANHFVEMYGDKHHLNPEFLCLLLLLIFYFHC